jgi:tyrosyl-tRNA synthetase
LNSINVFQRSDTKANEGRQGVRACKLRASYSALPQVRCSTTTALRLSRRLQFATTRTKIPALKVQELKVVNNFDWQGSLSLLAFLGGVGKRARVSSMLARERYSFTPPLLTAFKQVCSIKTRLQSASGISFTEFTYNLLQAYDFLHLFEHRGCTIQLGGSDQYGNIMAGIEMIQREAVHQSSGKEKAEAYGVTLPLLTTASGAKFGKSAGNAIWLEGAMTTPFDLYQVEL